MKKKDWFKDRGYPHFTNRISFHARTEVEQFISNPKNIACHSFYPLIFKTIIQRRYKISNWNGVEKRSHKVLKNGSVNSTKKIREILYASHMDAHIFSYYNQLLSKKYEKYLSINTMTSASISAYRQRPTVCNTKFKNNIHFANDAFSEIKARENCVALAFDIENFFPSLDHQLLKLRWASILGFKSLPKDHYNIFKAVTNFSYVKLEDLKFKSNHFDEKELMRLRKEGKNTFFDNFQDLINSEIIIHKNQKRNSDGKLIGIPQGLPISALLANLYLLPFDEVVIKELTEKYNIFYRRYSDDIIIVCKESETEMVENFIKNEIEKLKLTVSLPKTEITLFKNEERLNSFRLINGQWKKNLPLNYLGFEFYGYQTLLKSKNLGAFYREMKGSVRRKYQRSQRNKEKYLIDSAPIYKRKIYRLHSFKGVKTRKIPAKSLEIKSGKLLVKRFDRKFRGNYLRYAYKASEELNAPEIKRQVKNHWKILQSTLKKYEFSNVKNNR